MGTHQRLDATCQAKMPRCRGECIAPLTPHPTPTPTERAGQLRIKVDEALPMKEGYTAFIRGLLASVREEEAAS